ncbi:MAG: hypothetical protein JW746_06130 [Candidatus Krumholzibacteriota bacterium]|nr:hypothetical protein [Candidatus Krumholzibacteriota bacterium]
MSKRVITGILLTVLLLALARRMSMNRPEEAEISGGGIVLRHTTVFEQVGDGSPVLILDISSEAEDIAAAELVCFEPGRETEKRGKMVETEPGRWKGNLPGMDKGSRLRYYFEVETGSGRSLRMPGEGKNGFLVKYKGEVSGSVLLFHIIFMFGAFFFMIEAALCALRILSGEADKRMTILMVRWLVFFTFIGGWPLGFILNRQRFGPVWEGFPFGYDITDNKTQLMFIFWLITIILSWSSFIGKDEKADRVGRKGFAIAVLTSFIISLAIFLIPHSL